jgi:effector-binding domain-containing protein
MYIYNFYGPYGDLYKSYEAIRESMKQAGLEQVGPMREFYMNASANEPDSSKWLTRIMVPVSPKKS